MSERCQGCQGALTSAYDKERGVHRECETPSREQSIGANLPANWIENHGLQDPSTEEPND